MSVRVIATAMTVFDISLVAGIALYAVRQLRPMIVPGIGAWRDRWTPRQEAGAWQSARAHR
jgi:hypothetical protein